MLAAAEDLHENRNSETTQVTGATGATGLTGVTPLQDDEDEGGEPLPWSKGYVVHGLLAPCVYGCLCNSFWSGFPLHYLDMAWPLWRCGLAIALGFLLRPLTRQILRWRFGGLSVALVHLTLAILAAVFPLEEWACFLEVVALLGLDVAIGIESFAYLLGDTQEQHEQASATVISVFTIFSALSFFLGGLIYEYTQWQGVTVLHVSCQSLICVFFIFQILHPRPTPVEVISKAAQASTSPQSATLGKAQEKWEMHSVGSNAGSSPPKVAFEKASSVVPQADAREARGARDSQMERASTATDKSLRPRSRMPTMISKKSFISRLSESVALQSRWTQKMSQFGVDVNIEALVVQAVVFRDLRPVLAARAWKAHFDPALVVSSIRFPVTLILLAGFAMSFSLSSVLSSYALLLRSQGFSALSLGLVQTASEALAVGAIMMKSSLLSEEESLSKLPGWLWILVLEPYNLTMTLLILVLLNVLLMVPSAATMVVGQLFVATIYAVGGAYMSDLYSLYSFISRPDGIYSLELMNYTVELVSSAIAALVALSVADLAMDVSPAYLISGSVTLFVTVIFTVAFCARVQLDLLTTEVSRQA